MKAKMAEILPTPHKLENFKLLNFLLFEGSVIKLETLRRRKSNIII